MADAFGGFMFYTRARQKTNRLPICYLHYTTMSGFGEGGEGKLGRFQGFSGGFWVGRCGSLGKTQRREGNVKSFGESLAKTQGRQGLDRPGVNSRG